VQHHDLAPHVFLHRDAQSNKTRCSGKDTVALGSTHFFSGSRKSREEASPYSPWPAPVSPHENMLHCATKTCISGTTQRSAPTVHCSLCGPSHGPTLQPSLQGTSQAAWQADPSDRRSQWHVTQPLMPRPVSLLYSRIFTTMCAAAAPLHWLKVPTIGWMTETSSIITFLFLCQPRFPPPTLALFLQSLQHCIDQGHDSCTAGNPAQNPDKDGAT
jgi:hypothetical protein